MDWKDIKWFHQVVVHGSFSAAARANSTTQATISRRIKNLEISLGKGLFIRGLEGSVLTEDGQRLKMAAAKMDAAYEEFVRETSSISNEIQPITVTCGALIGMFLSKNIASLYQGLDQVEIELKTSNEFLNLEKGEADLALRNQRPSKGRLKARKLKSTSYGTFSVFGSETSFSKGEAKSISALKKYNWIGHAKNLAHSPTAKWIASHIGEKPIKFRMNSTTLILEATGQNTAVSLLPRFIGLSTPGLVEVYGPVDLAFEMWMVRREDSEGDRNLARLMANIEILFAD